LIVCETEIVDLIRILFLCLVIPPRV